ncbi:MAG: hypothetical protein IJB17_04255 [Oscillospiraceae bacterium]|nr:hypothetical protein [Oscillospiraceae bacterium]
MYPPAPVFALGQRLNAEQELEGLAISFSITGILMAMFQWCEQGFAESPRILANRLVTILDRLFVGLPEK